MPRGARVGSDSSTRRRPSPPTPTTTTQAGPAPRGDAGRTSDNHGNLGNGRRRRETPTEGAPHQLRAPAGRRGALSAMSPLPPRPSARPARRLLRYAPPRRGAGRDDDSDDIGPETPADTAEGGETERGETQLRCGRREKSEAPQPETPAACPSPASDRRREPKGVGACIGRRKTRGRHAAELPACRRPASAAERRGMAQECRRRAARWVSRPSPTLKPDHTSPADTCQRLRRIMHDTLTE